MDVRSLHVLVSEIDEPKVVTTEAMQEKKWVSKSSCFLEKKSWLVLIGYV
jgi:hypothetical protein